MLYMIINLMNTEQLRIGMQIQMKRFVDTVTNKTRNLNNGDKKHLSCQNTKNL